MEKLDELVHSAQKIVQKFDRIQKEYGMQESSEHIVDLIRMGEEDASVTVQMATIFQIHEADRQRLRAQVNRLNVENQWLREELSHLRKRFNENEQMRVCLEVELDQQKFNRELQSIEDRVGGGGESCNESTTNSVSLDDKSSVYFKKSLSVSSSTLGDIPPRLKTLHNLVLHYASQGKYEIAVPLCRETLDDLEKNLGREHPDVASMLNILALVYRDQGKFNEATQLLYNALAIREKTLGVDNLAVAATLNNLAVLHGKRNKYKEAHSLCERALKIRQSKLGEVHVDVAKQLTNLAYIKLTLGDLSGTETCYRKALNIYTKLAETLNESDKLALSKTYIQLAHAYLRQKKYAEAESTLYDCLNVKLDGNEAVKVDGPSGAPLVTVCNLLSNIYRKQGMLEIASRLDDAISTSTPNDEHLRSILTVCIGSAQMSERNLISTATMPQVFKQIPTRFKATLKRFNSATESNGTDINQIE